jgi:Cutinase
MKRLVVIAAALLTLTGASNATATASLASVCQPNGTGCTKAGTYPGPNALISSNYTGFKIIWTKSAVQSYSSGGPLSWTAYMTYTNIGSSALTLGCPGSWTKASYVSEHMSGGSGDDGTVTAGSTTCSQNPGLAVSVVPGGSYTLSATFYNVPWPGSGVSVTWGGAGTSPTGVYPFQSGPCQNWYVLGLHGVGQGPEPSGGAAESPELSAFASDLVTDAPIYGHAAELDVPYPTISVSWQFAGGVFNQGPLWTNVQAGVTALQNEVKTLTSACPASLISLFGYSEGAWIIDVWELQNPAEAARIYSAGLIGDPCYANSAGDGGLARLFTGTCGPVDDYMVGETNIQPTNSDCLAYDPVCGRGYGARGSIPLAAAQLSTAATCTIPNGCVHYAYVPDGDVASMASWMLQDTT